MQKMNPTGVVTSYLKKAVLWCRHNPRKVDLLFPMAFSVVLVIIWGLL